MNGLLVVLSFLGLFMLGFPVVVAIGLPSIAYLLLNDLPLQMVAQRTLYALDSFPLVAVPVFIFVGSLMNGAGISKVIYRFADTAVGRLPGGLAQVNIFGSLVFAGMSGSALADIGGIGRIEIDAMKSKGFKPAFASAITSASAVVGPIFPPSIPLILYGTVTGVSVIQLLLGGILPGLLCVAALMLMTAWLSVRRGYPRAQSWPTLGRLWADFLPALPALMAPVILIAGMLAGWFTPTEIAAVTVAYALLVSALFCNWRMRSRVTPNSRPTASRVSGRLPVRPNRSSMIARSRLSKMVSRPSRLSCRFLSDNKSSGFEALSSPMISP